MLDKYVLVVDYPDGPLLPIAPKLKERGYKVLLQSDMAQASRFIERTRLLCMCVFVNSGIADDNGRTFLRLMKDIHPSMPLVWVENAAERADFGVHCPDIIIADTLDTDSLCRDVERLLCRYHYPPELIGSLQDCVLAVMSRSYKTQLRAAKVSLCSNQDGLEQVSVMIPFGGAHVLGHMLVSATPEHLRIIYGRVVSDRVPQEEDSWDIAGEICNQIMGLTKDYFLSNDMEVSLGLPLYIGGHGVKVRWKGTRPSLIMSFDEPEGSMHVELCFESVDSRKLTGAEWREAMDTGDLIFL